MTSRKKRSAKTGLAPGTLVHIGRETGTPLVSVLDYDADNIREFTDLTAADVADIIKTTHGTIWVNIQGLGNTAILEQIGACFGLHPLVLEDILNTEQRPKLEDYGQYLYVVLRTFEYKNTDTKEKAGSNQISLILGKNFVLSFLETGESGLRPVREGLLSGKGLIRKSGADFLMYSLIDAVVDSYFLILEQFDEKTGMLETELAGRPKPDTLHAIYDLKREGTLLKRTLWPLREVISSLQRGDSALLNRSTLVYLRDVYDHTIHIIESVESLRDLTAGMLDIYVSSISYRISKEMKVLTLVTTIFMPMTLIASIYGMNFEHLPGSRLESGFYIALGAMAVTGLAMLAFFSRR